MSPIFRVWVSSPARSGAGREDWADPTGMMAPAVPFTSVVATILGRARLCRRRARSPLHAS